jgi:hypothetical protein
MSEVPLYGRMPARLDGKNERLKNSGLDLELGRAKDALDNLLVRINVIIQMI